MPSLGTQTAWLLLLAIPVACAAWTVTHEEVFREPREYCARRSEQASRLVVRKFFYLFTCEYCFSHYVALLALWMTGWRFLLPDWRGVVLAWFAVVWVANQYMSIFGRLRIGIKSEGLGVKVLEEKLSDTVSPTPEAPR
ncbi:hypothetical protein HKW67_15660 [Gemmatimonas groenlandica]|uniref:Uncharacterized protein n=2 Tax=Gemmatimonas groenlandica TaxID=2732249 RepID=A0A6M4IXG1_9BACT|nr:hypothetical protein HKW67_15660 [Gemmatimonas groenlandica]